jgi:hypothetical protein
MFTLGMIDYNATLIEINSNDLSFIISPWANKTIGA